jgi:DNA polymerase elongation subunit (family B)
MARPGLFRHVHKFDVTSQYPFIMLSYRCGTRKDPDGVFFSILKALRMARLDYKAKGSTDPEAKNISEALKIVINSAYGMLGSTHPYNDMDSAAKVCEYGREIVKKIMTVLKSLGAIIIETDTDGVMFCVDNYSDYIKDVVLSKMPDGLDLEHEFEAEWVYVDAAKNYIIALQDKVVRKGNFRKRNMPVLYREFVETFCRKYLEGPAVAEAYYLSMVDSIASRNMPLSKISVHRTIGKAEKATLKYGNIGEKKTFYKGYEEGNKKAVPVVEGLYNIEFYKNLVDKWYKTVKNNIETVHELKGVGDKKDVDDGEKPEKTDV